MPQEKAKLSEVYSMYWVKSSLQLKKKRKERVRTKHKILEKFHCFLNTREIQKGRVKWLVSFFYFQREKEGRERDRGWVKARFIVGAPQNHSRAGVYSPLSIITVTTIITVTIIIIVSSVITIMFMTINIIVWVIPVPKCLFPAFTTVNYISVSKLRRLWGICDL